MPKITQPNRKMYETPQVIADQMSTEMYGGDAPTHADIIKSANARAQKRHEVKGQHVADVGVLPDSAEMIHNEMVGARNSGYLVKKGLEFGVNAFYNTLPPGMDIEDQENSDIRKMDLYAYEGGLGYPGDGWVYRASGSMMPKTKDMGRPSMTNAVSGKKI